MALGKDCEINDTDLTASYWRIRRITADFPPDGVNDVLTIEMEGWSTAAARHAGKRPADHRVFNISPGRLPPGSGLTKDGLYTALYAAILGFPEFSNATQE
jgi:hypothetical protein